MPEGFGPTVIDESRLLVVASPIVSWVSRYVRSSIGAKHVMAVTGLLLVLFAIIHMLGHLQMFGGQDMYNAYAHFLQELWEVKWPVRFGLLALLVVHVVLALALTAKNRSARATRYAVYRPVRSSWVGRSMALSGIIVLAFLIFHILHFTIGQVQPGTSTRWTRRTGGTRTRCSSTASRARDLRLVPRRHRPALAPPRPRRLVVAAVARLAAPEVQDGSSRSHRLGVPVRRLHDPADGRAARHPQAPGA